MKRLLFAAGLAAATLTACTDGGSGSNQQGQDSTMHHHDAPAGNTAQGSNEMQRIMDKMMADMHAMKPSGNPDRDFATMMISHHQGALEMAKAELATGKDAQIRKLAERIVAAQEKEIAEMQSIVATLSAGDAAANKPAFDALMGSMGSMMAHTAPATGKPDHDFVAAMIPHHEGAVEMAKVQLQYGRNDRLKAMAQKMITDQEAEIAEMKAWLVANP